MLNDDINSYLGVFAYPLASLECIKDSALQKWINAYKQNDENKYEAKKDLRDKVARYIRTLYHVHSLDQVYLFLDKWYLFPRDDYQDFNTEFEYIYYHLKKFSKSFISQRDGEIVYKYWENEQDEFTLSAFGGSNKIYLFHCFNRLIPTDILAIIYFVKNGKGIHQLNGNYGNIIVSDALLDKVLKKGVSENHIHANASANFLSMWEEYMSPVTENNISTFRSLRLINPFSSDKKALLDYLFIGGLLRAYICYLVNTSNHRNLENTKPNNYKFENTELNNDIVSLFEQLFCGNTRDFIYSEDSITHKENPCWITIKWNTIISALNCQADDHSFIQKALGVTNEIKTTDENIFLFNVVDYLENNSSDDKYMRDNIQFFFLNYLRIKNFFYSVTVQSKTTYGLDYFQNYFRNSTSFNKNSIKINNKKLCKSLLQFQFQSSCLKKVELRVTFDEKERECKKKIREWLEAYKEILEENYYKYTDNNGVKKYTPIKPVPRIGIIVHMVKSSKEYNLQECCVQTDKNRINYQYADKISRFKIQMDNMKKIRESYGMDKYIVGIDVASLENALPTWVFASIYEEARDSRMDALETTNREDNITSKCQSLGFTIHAGEDFRHIMSGLRRIYEAVEFLKFHAGDRIGHGIALGISIKDWYISNPTVILPRVELLENYIWAYTLLSKESPNGEFINISYLEKQIHKYAKQIFGGNHVFTTNLLVDVYHQLYKPNNINDDVILQCPHCNSNKCCCTLKKYIVEENVLSWNAKTMAKAYHCSSFIIKMDEPIHVKITNQDIAIAEELQRVVQRKVNEKGIIIEVNPSSNIIISSIGSIAEHHVYSINNDDLDFDNVLTCVNSDDPCVFNTNICNELGYIYFGMIDKGVDREKTLAWIDKLRETGNMASFIRNETPDSDIICELNRTLDSFC